MEGLEVVRKWSGNRNADRTRHRERVVDHIENETG